MLVFPFGAISIRTIIGDLNEMIVASAVLALA
jgi:hypothetical protein